MQVGETFLGRPCFGAVKPEKENLQTPSIPNTLCINHLKPGEYDSYSLLGRIQAFVMRIFQFFGLVKPPQNMACQAAVHPTNAIMFNLFKRCLPEGDAPHILLQQHDDLLRQVRDLTLLVDEEKQIPERLKFKHSFNQKIKDLNSGQRLLLPFSSREDVSMFYLLQKTASHTYSLKVIGCDHWMAQLSGVPNHKMGGKEKILSQITFSDIPADYFTEENIQTIFCQPLLEHFFDTTLIKSQLDKIPKECRIDESGKPERWVVQSSGARKALALVTQELQSAQGVDPESLKGVRKRLEFQTRLVSVFDFYKAVRFFLEQDKNYSITLRRLTQEIAKEASILGVKGVLSDLDLEEIHKELEMMTKTIEKAEKKSVPAGLGKIAPATLQFPIGSKICAPAKLLSKPIEKVETFIARAPVIMQQLLPLKINPFITAQEAEIWQSSDAKAALTLLHAKTAQIQQLSRDGNQKLAVGHVIEVAKYFLSPAIHSHSSADQNKAWQFHLSIEGKLQVQNDLLALTTILATSGNEGIPFPNRAMTLLWLARFASWLDSDLPPMPNGSSRHSVLDHALLDDIFNNNMYTMGGLNIPHDMQRPFYLVDEENAGLVESHCQQMTYLKQFSFHCTPQQSQTSHEYMCQQEKLVGKFFGVSDDALSYRGKFNAHAFQPQQILRWSKAIGNPFFMAALRQAKMQGVHLGILEKLSAQKKLVNVGVIYSSSGLKLDREWKPKEELAEMQKELDRFESLKIPEAASDNPSHVFEAQFSDLQQRMQESGEEVPQASIQALRDFKKEELTDLLSLLRGESPQLEVIGFMKTHPHLLANPDVRNYLEIIMFDVGGSSFQKTLEKNPDFAKTVPHILGSEIQKYRLLVKKDPQYYHQLLFSLLMVRKCRALYAFYNKDIKELDRILDGQDIGSILGDAALRPYHYRAVFEQLMRAVTSPESIQNDLTTTVRYFHLLRALPKERHDFDPNEHDKLERHYAKLVQSLKGTPVEQLASLLDAICGDRGLKLDRSSWSGSYPVFSNAQYRINVAQGTIADRALEALLVAMPPELISQPAYTATFGTSDPVSLHVKAVAQNETTIYLVSDKSGAQGRVEVGKEGTRFYRKFPHSDTLFQVMPLEKREDLHALCSLVGKALYISSDNPQEGLALDATGKTLFKVQLKIHDNKMEVLGVTDCRGEKESVSYAIHTLAGSPHAFAPLKGFEHEKDILAFIKEGEVAKIEFLRYGLAFTLKEGKFYSDDKRHRGYAIDFQAALPGLPHALVMRHADETMPAKVLLPDLSVMVSKEEKRALTASFLQKCGLLLKTWWTGRKPDPLLFQATVALQGPQHTDASHLEFHSYHIRPYSGELVPTDKKKKIESNLALMAHALFNGNHLLALQTLQQFKLMQADLSRPKVKQMMEFLTVSKEDDGNAAAIKIQIALQLRQLMGKKMQFGPIVAKLENLVSQHCALYLREGRKIYQRLQLNESQFEVMAHIVKGVKPEFYEEHLRIFFLKEGDKLPSFNPLDGRPVWQGYAAPDHAQNIQTAQKAGAYGTEAMPIENLEVEVLSKAPEKNSIIILEALGTPLLFEEEALKVYFEASDFQLPEIALPDVEGEAPSCEKAAVKKLQRGMKAYIEQVSAKKRYTLSAKKAPKLQQVLAQLEDSCKHEAEKHRAAIDLLLGGNGHPLEALAIQGGLQKVATFQEVSLAFMQKDLETLAKKQLLPSTVDLPAFKALLAQYFQAETKRILLLNACKLMDQPDLLHQLLTTKRFYSTERNPELLVYECFSQQVFRQLGAGENQVQLLCEMLANPNGVYQAITGSGKTTVLSVLRGLMQANGTNLVTFRILPALLEQSRNLLQQKLGDTFHKKIYTLQFNLKMSPIIREKRKNAKNEDIMIEESLFKKIYQELLSTMREKGCVLQDYKSIPLMQEKWVKLNREFRRYIQEGRPIPDIERDHWIYLKKILVLVKAREEVLMDEFDVPNKSCNRLQIPIGKTVDLPPFLYENSLELYELLRADPRLKLTSDLQREVGAEVRQAVIHDLAKIIAGSDQDLLDYFLGRREFDFSNCSAEVRDTYTLCKDQFTIFLPLALGMNGINYKRSSDGKRTVPCHEGEAQENSRFGHPLEEINYTIQDYMQNGVSSIELSDWIKTLQNEAIQGSEMPRREFAKIFPNSSLPKGKLEPKQLKALQEELNGDWEKVKVFLHLKLKELRVNSAVISMTPHDAAALSKAVSGLSATLGCPEELPAKLQIDPSKANSAMGEMVYRLIERTGTQKKTLDFDPEKPLEVLKQGKFVALIDGAGAYRAFSAQEVAQQFKEAQPTLKQVGYADVKLDFVGENECTLPEKGFYFTKVKARGADIPLDAQAEALLTVDGQKTIEDLVQNEGRMRLKGQKIRIARNKLNPDIATTEDLIVRCARNEGANDAHALFRSKMQQIPHLVRQAAYKQLLAIESLEETVKYFEKVEDLFIENPPHDYNKAGTYHAKNHRIQEVNSLPGAVLEAKKAQWLETAKSLALDVSWLETLNWDVSLLAKMPPLVPSMQDTVATGLEVEQEMEVEHQIEAEMDVEIENEIEEELHVDQCGDVPFYPAWVAKEPKEYSAQQWLHPAFDRRIVFTENFLPVERQDSLFKRTPFDHAMPKIHTLHISAEPYNLKKVILGDVLDDVLHRPYQQDLFDKTTSLTNDYRAISYDLRTRTRVAGENYCTQQDLEKLEPFYEIVAQVRFINGEYEGYSAPEWRGLRSWLKKVKNPQALCDFFEKTILRTQPRKAAAFKDSPLYSLFLESVNG